jgi:hypothetical protein
MSLRLPCNVPQPVTTALELQQGMFSLAQLYSIPVFLNNRWWSWVDVAEYSTWR